MTCSHLRLTTLLFLALAGFVVQPTGAVAEYRSYQFLPEQDRLFSFAGGLTGTNAAAQLAGSLDIEIDATGSARVTQFNIQLVDILDASLVGVNWMEGDSLASHLFLDPTGLTGQRSGNIINIGPIATEPSEPVAPITNIFIEELGNGQASIRISSRPYPYLDSPAMFTESPGFAARIVPEPGVTILLVSCGLATAFSRRQRPVWFKI